MAYRTVLISSYILLSQHSQSAAAVGPHTFEPFREYAFRDTYTLTNITSLTQLNALSSNTTAAWLVAALDDLMAIDVTGDATGRSSRTCGFTGEPPGFNPILLRQAHRERHAPFLRLGVMRRSTFLGSWPFDAVGHCSITLLPQGSGTMGLGMGRGPRHLVGAHPLQIDASNGFGRATIMDEVKELVRTALHAKMTFYSEYVTPVDVEWLGLMATGELTKNDLPDLATSAGELLTSLPHRTPLTFDTQIGHTFAFYSTGAMGRQLVGYHTVSKEDDAIIIDELTAARCRAALRPIDPHSRDIVEATSFSDTAAHLLEHIFDLGMIKRMAQSEVQAHFTPPATRDGFRLMKLDDEIFQPLARFYAHAYPASREMEKDGGPLYNTRAVKTWHTEVTNELREFLFEKVGESKH